MKKSQILMSLIRGRELTPKRTINFLRNYYALMRKNPLVPGYPSIIMIEPTNICNLKCPLCPTGNGSLSAPRGFMKFAGFKKIIDECGDYLLNVTLWNWGEPFLNKDIFEMIEYAKAKRIFVRVSTNGHPLQDEANIERVVRSGMDELIYAVDGATQETYEMYRRNGSLETVRSNLKKLVAAKRRLKSRTPFIELQFIVMRHNEHEVPRIKEMAREIGVDGLRLKTVSLELGNAQHVEGDTTKITGYKPQNEQYSRYQSDMKRKEIRDDCERLWLSSVVNWDGTISPCCNDPNREFVFGNVIKSSFKEVWNGHRYVNFRRTVLRNKGMIDLCKNCSGALMGLEVENVPA